MWLGIQFPTFFSQKRDKEKKQRNIIWMIRKSFLIKEFDNLSTIQGHSSLCFRDGPQLPPLNFDTICITFWRYDFSSMNRYIVMTINDIYVNNFCLSLKKVDNEAVLLDFHSLSQTMDLSIVPSCVTRTDLSYLP